MFFERSFLRKISLNTISMDVYWKYVEKYKPKNYQKNFSELSFLHKNYAETYIKKDAEERFVRKNWN